MRETLPRTRARRSPKFRSVSDLQALHTVEASIFLAETNGLLLWRFEGRDSEPFSVITVPPAERTCQHSRQGFQKGA